MVHVCPFNKTAIGQFIHIKYKVGIKNMAFNITVYAIASFTLKLSNIKLKYAVIPTVPATTSPNLYGNLLSNGMPLRSTNFLFLLSNTKTFTLDPLHTIKGIPMMVDHIAIVPKFLCISLTQKVKHIPKTIPSQNTRFQKLSLLRRDFINCIREITKNILNFSVTLQAMLCQLIIGLTLIIPAVCTAGSTGEELSIAKLINDAEKQYEIPKGLLLALAKVESSLNPYAINFDGKNLSANNAQKALSIINEYLKAGHTNIDVGIMQINYYWHGKNFDSITEMLCPKSNIEYGAKLLVSLYKRYKSWYKAVRLYHSSNSIYYQKYTPKILLAWVGS